MANESDLIAIKAALDANPATYGALSDAAAAAEMNDPNGAHAVDNWADLDGGTIARAIVHTEFAALTQEQRDYVSMICSVGGTVDTAPGSQVRAAFAALFSGGDSAANLLALANQRLSHADVIGVGTVEESDIQQARALV